MAKDDWYRRTTWTPEDREAFFARLERSRTYFHKAQYLRIQAVTLRDQQNFSAAEELATLLLDKYSSETTEIESALLIVGDCRAAQGLFEESLKTYCQAALFRLHEGWNMECGAWAAFGISVVCQRRIDYAGTLRFVLVAREEIHGEFLRRYQFISCGLKSWLAWHDGEKAASQYWAERSLQELYKTHSGMRYHPTFGVANPQDRDGAFANVVKMLAAGNYPPLKHGFDQLLRRLHWSRQGFLLSIWKVGANKSS